eukprot:904_1
MGACVCADRNYSKLDEPEYKCFPPLEHDYKQHVYCRKYPLQLVQSNKNSWETMRHFKIVFLGESKVGKTSIISQKVSYKFETEYAPTIEDYYVKVHRMNVDDINGTLANRNRMDSLRSSRSMSQPSLSTRHDANGINYNMLPCFHCILDIQDTSGSLDFRRNVNQWIWRSQVFVIVFDLTDRASFDSIETAFISRIIEVRKCDQPPIILVGNKSDEVETNAYYNYVDSKLESYLNNKNANQSPTTAMNQNDVTLDMIEEMCNKYNIIYIECSAKERQNVNLLFDVCVKERLFHEAYRKKEVFMAQKNPN